MGNPSVVLAFAFAPNKIGGMEAFAEELARQLKLKGWDLTLWFEDTAPAVVRDFLLAPGNVTLDVYRRQPDMSARSILRFLRLLLKRRPTVLVYSLGGVVRWWPVLARAVGVRRVSYFDGTSRTELQKDYKASRRIKAFMSPLSEAICATQFVKSCSEQEEIVPASKSIVIYSGTDTQREHGDGAAFKRRFNIPAERIVVLKVSWLVPEKGIDVALRAAQRTLAVRDDLHYVFCGEGAFRKEYEDLARELGIEQHVTWTGQVQDLIGSGAFKAADLMIQCSQWQEAFCLAVAEGMSAGLPVIASRIGGLPELISEGENGFLFDPASDEALATNILTLASDHELRGTMAQESRARAVKTFDLKTCVGQWVDVVTAA